MFYFRERARYGCLAKMATLPAISAPPRSHLNFITERWLSSRHLPLPPSKALHRVSGNGLGAGDVEGRGMNARRSLFYRMPFYDAVMFLPPRYAGEWPLRRCRARHGRVYTVNMPKYDGLLG